MYLTPIFVGEGLAQLVAYYSTLCKESGFRVRIPSHTHFTISRNSDGIDFHVFSKDLTEGELLDVDFFSNVMTTIFPINNIKRLFFQTL